MITVKRFSASWCQPCKILAPLFLELESEYPNVIFETIDVDTNIQEVKNYVIVSVPTVIIEKNGELVRRFAGAKPKSEYTKVINSLI